MTDMDDGDILDDSLQGKILSLLTGNCSTYCSHRPIRPVFQDRNKLYYVTTKIPPDLVTASLSDGYCLLYC